MLGTRKPVVTALLLLVSFPLAPRGTGFGVLGYFSKIEKGIPDSTIKEFYEAAASSPLFKKKLALANLLTGGKKISVDDILLQLQKNTKWRQVSKLTRSRVDVLRNGTFVFRHSADTGGFSRATAHHELLHVAQFLRDPTLLKKARDLSALGRLPYEPIPALIGSPEIFGPPVLIVSGEAIYLLYEGGVFELFK